MDKDAPKVPSLKDRLPFSVKEKWMFLEAFAKNWRQNASVWPSSPMMCRVATESIDWSKAKVVVELGAGTGPITRYIRDKRLQPQTQLYAIEMDPGFVSLLNEQFRGATNIHVVEGNALHLPDIMSDFGPQGVDHIVSGLGVGVFPRETQDAYFAAIRSIMDPAGVYTQITERYDGAFQSLYERYFNHVTFKRVFWNIPPGGVFICKDPK